MKSFGVGLRLRVWWQCQTNPTHEWQAHVANRARIKRSLCPYCSGRFVSADNCLAETHPLIAAQWHPTKNGDLTPRDVHARRITRVWWQCDKHPRHVWDAPATTRVRGRGCVYCAGRRVLPEESLAALYPSLEVEWHESKNGSLLPTQVTRASSKKCWWRCQRNPAHEWEAAVSGRTRDKVATGCPHCYQEVDPARSLAVVNPRIASEWHPTRNGALTPQDFSYSSAKHVWWQCAKDPRHQWEATLANRTAHQASGCPYCCGQKVNASNCLATLHPELVSEWHPTLNGSRTPYNVGRSPKKYVWWVCRKGGLDHEYESNVAARVRGNGCPYCLGAWSKAHLKRFFRDHLGEWDNPEQACRIKCFEEAGIRQVAGKARSICEAVIAEDVALSSVRLWSEGHSAPEVDALMQNHLYRDYGGKDWIPLTLRQRVLEAKGDTCVICGSRENIHMDHILPESKGGPTTFENLQPLCGLDNSIKGCKNISNHELRERRAAYDRRTSKGLMRSELRRRRRPQKDMPVTAPS